jgi:predicted RND superfamily exporter protein
MLNILYKTISKWPYKVIGIMILLIIGVAIGVQNISLSTGNETLIDSDTDTYQDNLIYQSTFGTDPIMVIVEHDSESELLSYDSMTILNDLSQNIEGLDGVFYVNSPVNVVNTAGMKLKIDYQEGLNTLSSGLLSIAQSLETMSLSGDLDQEMITTTFANIIQAQNDKSDGVTNETTLINSMITTVEGEINILETRIASLDTNADADEINNLTRTIGILTSVRDVYSQMLTLNTNLMTGLTQTSTGLTTISQELTSMFNQLAIVQTNLSNLQTNLETMGNTLAMLAANFNTFEPAFPEEASTLSMMVYPNGTVNPMLTNFFINDQTMFVSIVLEEGTTQEDIETILYHIDNTLDNTMYENSLISGKPVLDYDIKDSMMSSMQTMMITSGIIMIIILFVLFKITLRLLPLMVVLIAVIATIGIMGLTSIPLTMVSMAVFPVLIGLGIDYSIQFHHRYYEGLEKSDSHE